jgi:hypothetical protein
MCFIFIEDVMKGIVVVSYCVLLVIGSLFSQFCSALSLGWQDSPILTTTGSQVLDVSWIESTTTEDSRSKSDPIRQGTSRPVSNPSSDDKTVGVIIASDEDGRITTHAGAIADLMKLLQSIINWSLGVLAFVALSYLIYH